MVLTSVKFFGASLGLPARYLPRSWNTHSGASLACVFCGTAKSQEETALMRLQCDIDSSMRLKIQAAMPQRFSEDGQKLETVVDRSTAAAWTVLLTACLGVASSRDHVISKSAIPDIHDWIFILYFVTDSPAIVSLSLIASLSRRFRQPVPASTDAEDVADEDIVEILGNEEISGGVT
ncbi:hypothetical protein C8J57DRAFT_1593520 [Mycena rebaudengoi]|nr:hypothetical protein C8J57DRAFT_1593520 [Mycena rebaudengoi]